MVTPMSGVSNRAFIYLFVLPTTLTAPLVLNGKVEMEGSGRHRLTDGVTARRRAGKQHDTTCGLCSDNMNLDSPTCALPQMPCSSLASEVSPPTKGLLSF